MDFMTKNEISWAETRGLLYDFPYSKQQKWQTLIPLMVGLKFCKEYFLECGGISRLLPDRYLSVLNVLQ